MNTKARKDCKLSSIVPLSGKSGGFTLVETLIASTILTLAVAGPLFTASRAIVAAQISRDQLTASYLAQEGIEHVRAVRDNAYLAAYTQSNSSSLAWTNFTSSISQCSTACSFDPVKTIGIGPGSSLLSCSGSSCTPLYLTANGIYTQSSAGATPTSFTRILKASAASANDEKIESIVSWSFHGIPYSVTISDHLTPWQ